MPELARNGSVLSTIQIVQRGGSCPELARGSAYGALRFHCPKSVFAGFVSVDISL